MTENNEEPQSADPQPESEPQLTRKERRAAGKAQPQQQFGVAPAKGKGAAVPSRRQYSNRRSG